jgi:predicted transcriptional regulator
MKIKDKNGKHSSLYLISDEFFTVMKRHHTLLLFLAHYMSIGGSRLILDEMMYDYLMKHVGISRANIQRFLRELQSVGALKRAGVSYYIHPDIFYKGKWVDRAKFFFTHGFDSIDKVISRYKELRDKIENSNIKRRSKKLSIVKSINS